MKICINVDRFVRSSVAVASIKSGLKPNLFRAYTDKLTIGLSWTIHSHQSLSMIKNDKDKLVLATSCAKANLFGLYATLRRVGLLCRNVSNCCQKQAGMIT